jgi:hypothetical protein
VELAFQAWFVQVRRPRIPAVDTGQHEGFILDGDDRADSVRSDELASTDRALGLVRHGQVTW